VEKAVGEFDLFVTQTRIRDSDATRGACKALEDDQKAAHVAICAHVEKMRDAFAHAADTGASGTFETFCACPSLDQVHQWRLGLELRLDAWDAAAFEDLKQLEYANGEVDGAVEKEIARSAAAIDAARNATFTVSDFEFKRVRDAESVERERKREEEGGGVEGGDTTPEDATTPNEAEETSGPPPTPAYASDSLVAETCVPKAAAVAASARLAETNATACVAEISNKWRVESTKIAVFVESAARLRETHLVLANRTVSSSEKALRALRQESLVADAQNEAAFEEARSVIVMCQAEAALDTATEKALGKLDDIETGYRRYWSEATSAANEFPANVKLHFDNYERRVCRLLRLLPNVSPKKVAELDDLQAGEAAAAEADEAAAAAGGGVEAPTDQATDAPAINAPADGESTPTEAAAETETQTQEKEKDPALVSWDAEDDLEQWLVEEETIDEIDVPGSPDDAAGASEGNADEGEGDTAPSPEPDAPGTDSAKRNDTPKPPPRERVTTRGGSSFTVWSDLVTHVVTPPHKPVLDENGEPVAKRGDGDDTKKDDEGETTPAPPPGFDPALRVSTELAAALIHAVRASLLEDYQSHFALELEHATTRAYEETQFLRDELELKLLKHKPRYGVCETHDSVFRRKTLRERASGFDRYLLSAARASKLADERFAASVNDCSKKSELSVAKVVAVTNKLAATTSVAALGIREKESARVSATAKNEFDSFLEALRDRAEANYEHVLTQTALCREQQGLPKAPTPEPVAEEEEAGEEEAAEAASTSVDPVQSSQVEKTEEPIEPAVESSPEPTEDTGAEEESSESSPATEEEESEEYVPAPGDDRYRRLGAVDQAARASFSENLSAIAELKRSVASKLNDAEENLATLLPHHKQDLHLLDLVRRAEEKAQFEIEKTQVEDLRAKKVLDATAVYLDKVGSGRSRAKDPVSHDLETTFEKVIDTVSKFRVLLLKRCRELEIVENSLVLDLGDVPIDLNDVALLPEAAQEGGEGEGEPAPDAAPTPETLAYSTRVSAILELARASITTAGETYYAEKETDRPSTRPETVPDAGVEALLATKKDRLTFWEATPRRNGTPLLATSGSSSPGLVSVWQRRWARHWNGNWRKVWALWRSRRVLRRFSRRQPQGTFHCEGRSTRTACGLASRTREDRRNSRRF
jgi:hypothetical protein